MQRAGRLELTLTDGPTAAQLCRLVSAWNAADNGSVLLELKYQLTVATKPRT